MRVFGLTALATPKDYLANHRGAIVQVGTSGVTLFPGFQFKHFTACDVFTRWHVLEAHHRANPDLSGQPGFLHTIVEHMPFPVQAIRVDGGSEFMAQFETACEDLGIKLSSSRPALPRSTATSNARTHKEEFYYRLTSVTLTQVNRLLRRWDDIHNRYRLPRPSARSPRWASTENAPRKEAGVRYHLNEHSQFDSGPNAAYTKSVGSSLTRIDTGSRPHVSQRGMRAVL
jgi:hypothetical protein